MSKNTEVKKGMKNIWGSHVKVHLGHAEEFGFVSSEKPLKDFKTIERSYIQ